MGHKYGVIIMLLLVYIATVVTICAANHAAHTSGRVPGLDD